MINNKQFNINKGLVRMMAGAACFMLNASLFTSCSDADSIPNVKPAYCAESITLDIPAEFQQLIYTDNTGAEVLPLVKGESVSVGYTLMPEDVTFSEVIWNSSNPLIASVENGKIDAISGGGIGYSIISVTPVGMYSGSGVSSTLKVKVDDRLIQASQITLSTTDDEVYEGETTQLSAEILPEMATYKTVKWTSSDNAVATVDAKGVVTGVKVAGTDVSCKVTITATALDKSGTSASRDITVKRIVAPEDITIDQSFAAPAYACAYADKQLVLSYTTVPANCTTSLIEWTSSDETIATVENGVVTFNQAGNFGDFTITATCPETGKSSTLRMSLPAGLVREHFKNPANYTWGAGSNASVEYMDGYAHVTTSAQNATNQRGDFKALGKTYICPANYPIIAFRIDDVIDRPEVTFRAFKFDTSGKDLNTGESFYGEIGNGSDKFIHDFLCEDGSHVYVYDFTTQVWGPVGMFPVNDIGEFTTFQIKYADMRPLTAPITYNVYWIQTFKTLDEVKACIEADGIQYEQKK